MNVQISQGLKMEDGSKIDQAVFRCAEDVDTIAQLRQENEALIKQMAQAIKYTRLSSLRSNESRDNLLKEDPCSVSRSQDHPSFEAHKTSNTAEEMQVLRRENESLKEELAQMKQRTREEIRTQRENSILAGRQNEQVIISLRRELLETRSDLMSKLRKKDVENSNMKDNLKLLHEKITLAERNLDSLR